MKEKEAAWSMLTTDFNAVGTSPCQREVLKLQKCWKNLEGYTKAKHLERVREQHATGDGPSKAPKDDAVIEKVEALLPKEVFGMTNEYDDGCPQVQCEEILCSNCEGKWIVCKQVCTDLCIKYDQLQRLLPFSWLQDLFGVTTCHGWEDQESNLDVLFVPQSLAF